MQSLHDMPSSPCLHRLWETLESASLHSCSQFICVCSQEAQMDPWLCIQVRTGLVCFTINVVLSDKTILNSA